MYGPRSDPNYSPALLTRFLHSQRAWNGEQEQEREYASSQEWAGWAAARPFPNAVPFVFGPAVNYHYPGGPTSPRDLMQQHTVPPSFPAGDYRAYLPPEARFPPLSPCQPPPPGCPSGGGGLSANDVALGIKKILPELATSIGVQTARANAKQVHAQPANVSPPVRSFPIAAGTNAPITISDGVFTTVVSFRVPRGLLAAFTSFGQELESAAAFLDTQWRIVVDGIPVLQVTDVQYQMGDFAHPAEINVKAIEDQLVQVQATVLTPATNHFARAKLGGWTFQPSLMANLDSIYAWRGQ